TTEQRIVDRAGQATEKALDKTEGAIVCVATDVACIQDARKQGKQVSVTDANGNAVSGEDSAAAIAAANGGAPASLKPGEGAWANYDFVPGDRPIFLED